MVSESSETYFDPSDADEIDRSALAGEDLPIQVGKTYGDTAATDDQAPDAPARPTIKKNVTSKGRELLPPEEPEGRRGLSDSKDKSETSEEQRAEAVLQGEDLTRRRRSSRP